MAKLKLHSAFILSTVFLLPTTALAKAGDDSCGVYVNSFETRSESVKVYEAWLEGYLESKGTPYPDKYAITLWVKNYCSEHPIETVRTAAKHLNAALRTAESGGSADITSREVETTSEELDRPTSLPKTDQLDCSDGFRNGRYGLALPNCWAKASGGDTEAAYNLAVMYSKGYGAQKDLVVSLMWAIIASEVIKPKGSIARQSWQKASALRKELTEHFLTPAQTSEARLLSFRYANVWDSWKSDIIERNPEVSKWMPDSGYKLEPYIASTPETAIDNTSSSIAANFQNDKNDCIQLAGSGGGGSFAFGPIWFVLPMLLIQEAANAASKQAAQEKYLECMRARGHTNVSLPTPGEYQSLGPSTESGVCASAIRGGSTWENQGCEYQ